MSPVKANNNSVQEYTILAVGGSSAITKVYGPDVAVSRIDTGDYKLTFSKNIGTLLGVNAQLLATDPTALIAHDITTGTLDTTDPDAPTMLVNVNGASAAHDLAANEWFSVTVKASHYPDSR